LNCGIVLARKKGKLPFQVERQEYALEYGTDCIEMHKGSLLPGENCLVVDDLLATGGTCAATCDLTRRLGGNIIGCAFIIELPELGGRAKLAGMDVHSLVSFEGH
jgi:adenine phosphoribosyltransferase